jgi:hypothetical protein
MRAFGAFGQAAGFRDADEKSQIHEVVTKAGHRAFSPGAFACAEGVLPE